MNDHQTWQDELGYLGSLQLYHHSWRKAAYEPFFLGDDLEKYRMDEAEREDDLTGDKMADNGDRCDNAATLRNKLILEDSVWKKYP